MENKEFLDSFIMTSGISVGPDIARAYNIHLDLCKLFRPLLGKGYIEFVSHIINCCGYKENSILSKLEVIGVYGLQDVFAKELYENIDYSMMVAKSFSAISAWLENVCHGMLINSGNVRLTDSIELYSCDSNSQVICNGKVTNNLGITGLRLKLTLSSVYLLNGLGKWDKIGSAPYKRNKELRDCKVYMMV